MKAGLSGERKTQKPLRSFSLPATKLKLKTCKNKGCTVKFPQFNSIVVWCSPKCGQEIAAVRVKKDYDADTVKMKKEYRVKNRSYQLRLAQPAFNAFIRERDRKLSCPSCGRWDHEIKDNYTGGKWDCGHFLSIGAHPELRFEELNAHKQCKSCNGGSGRHTLKKHTVSQEYRERLIQRIGLAKVEWLEGPHDAKKYTASDLIEIKETYKAKLKELQHD